MGGDRGGPGHTDCAPSSWPRARRKGNKSPPRRPGTVTPGTRVSPPDPISRRLQCPRNTLETQQAGCTGVPGPSTGQSRGPGAQPSRTDRDPVHPSCPLSATSPGWKRRWRDREGNCTHQPGQHDKAPEEGDSREWSSCPGLPVHLLPALTWPCCVSGSQSLLLIRTPVTVAQPPPRGLNRLLQTVSPCGVEGL